jgi:hypothetical protein
MLRGVRENDRGWHRLWSTEIQLAYSKDILHLFGLFQLS